MFYLLLVVETAYQQRVVAQGHKAVVEALDDGLVAILYVDYAVLCVNNDGMAASMTP